MTPHDGAPRRPQDPHKAEAPSRSGSSRFGPSAVPALSVSGPLQFLHMARFTMRCPVCGEQFSRKGWFSVQWNAEKPVVMGTPSGDYDRCKACYSGHAAAPWTGGAAAPAGPAAAPWTGGAAAAAAGPAAAPAAAVVDRRSDDHAKELCRQVVRLSQRCIKLNLFIDYWVDRGMHNRGDICNFGAIDCITESDPKQYLYAQRWTFDPMNWNYEKAFHLSWRAHVRQMNRVTIGNILESVLGTRNMGDQNGWPRESQRAVVTSVCTNISNYVNAVYQLTAYTGTVYDDVDAWTRYVTYHATY